MPRRANTTRAAQRPAQAPAAGNGAPWLTVVGARHNNLRKLTVRIPLERFVCVTGVSGSGKSSLVNDIIRETLARDLNGAENVEPGAHDAIEGTEHLDKVIDIDQSPIGRTPRSNPSTYIKVFDLIRDLYARLPDAKVRGYRPGRFSFNVETGAAGGGRCEACEGNGSNRVEMDFLADIWVTCAVCGGRRFNRETLQILYRGKSIADALDMDVQQALAHFENQPRIRAMLQTLHDVGMDYVKLGQSSTTLSGGEAQRIKLARELVKKSTGRTLYLLDEPTTGLHFDDIRKLLTVLHGFVDAGNSVMVIEHNLDVIKTADWVIDLGPEGGEGGGRIVAEGTPEQVADNKRSHTGAALRTVLAPTSRGRGKGAAKAAAGARTDPGRDGRARTALANRRRRGSEDVIRVVGARQHNLKDVTVDVPRGKMTVCTGPSGSGKSSFAIDTVYTEGQRRYVESLSAYARQFIGQLQPPKVEHVSGLSPAICIEQQNTSRSPRSTVGTVTEIYDYMRILWSRIGQPHCPRCRVPVGTQTSEEIVDRVLALGEGTPCLLLAPVTPTGQESFAALLTRERANGYVRARIDGAVRSLDGPIEVDERRPHAIELVVDRLVVRRARRSRITDSVEQALALGNGVIVLAAGDEAGDASGDAATTAGDVRLSQHRSCPQCGSAFEELTPHHFSFNSRLGWCEQCEGLGTQLGASSANIVVHPTRSILDGAIAGWEQVPPGSKLHILLASLADFIGFHPDQPWNLLGEAHRLQVLHGCGEEWISVRVPRSAPAALHRELSGVRFRWRGFYPAISRATRVSWQYRKRLEELVTEVPCDACLGGRLKPEPAAVRLGESTLHEVCTKPLGRTLEWFQGLRLDARQRRIAGELLHEVTSRLRFLVDVGLDYVTLHRVAGTLSGGEAQRIQLASQIGTGLTGVLYVLDEPTIGLHPRDNARLIAALGRLRALGNTLLVVEHDREVIGAADHVLDFGPGAGRYGGEITATGSPKRLRSNPASLTGKYLSGRASIPVPANRRPMATVERWLTIHGARENNLREIEVRFPLGRLTCITGVSGSGKSTLIAQILYPALASRLHGARLVPGGHDRLSGVEHVDKVINVDQSPIGNSPTSNAATYTGVFDEIRELFAKLPEAKVRGYGANRFSFNRPGGRCEACEGMGQRRIEMHFLPDVWIECENCGGTRYVPETLDVQFRGKSIADVLKLSVREACELFQSVPRVARMLRTLDDVGLGYLHLGQAAPTLSGGEAQRVKLAAELGRPSTGKTLYLLDEPTTGLHLDDLRKLLSVLHRLVDLGNTCVVIEHNLDVIKTADWVIDLGPEAGDDGGTIVVEGTPEQAATVKESHTGRALGAVLAAGPSEARPVHGPTSVTTGASAATAAAREGPGSAETAPEFSAEVRMPWERDGRRWHTERTDRQGRPIRWDPKLLTWLVETIEVAGDFAPTNWNSQARIEIKAPGKCEWFAHLLTGGRDLLDVLIRFPHGLLTPTQVRQALDLKTLDERTDLPIYGQQERAVLRARSPEWDEIRCTPRDFADVNRTKWRALLRRCAAAYMKQARAQQQDPGRGEPWREDGRTWHLSQQSISKNHMVRWQPTLLVALLGLFDKLQRDLRVDWKGKVCIGLKVPGEAKPAGKIVTNMGAGLRLELRTPPTMFTPAQVERLGFNREIRRGTECDWVIFWARSLDHLDREQLLGVWRESRAFFDVAATGDTGRRQAS